MSPRQRRLTARMLLGTVGWYLLLLGIAAVFVFPLLWMVLTSLKGPTDAVFSVPPRPKTHECSSGQRYGAFNAYEIVFASPRVKELWTPTG